MESISGEVWLREWAKWIRVNEAKLSDASNQQASRPSAGAGLGSWLGHLIGAGSGSDGLSARQRTISTPAQPRRPAQTATTTSSSSSTSASSSPPLALRLTVHQLFYILSRADALSLPVGPLDVRISGLVGSNDRIPRPASYLSFLNNKKQNSSARTAGGPLSQNGDDSDAKSVNSVKSTFSLAAPNTWFGLGSSLGGSSSADRAGAPAHPVVAEGERDLKYVYSALTKIPSLRLTPAPLPPNGKIIKGYEDNCPGAYAVPLDIFKNVQVLETVEVDPRSLIGWDRLSMQLRSLTCSKSGIEDVTDLLVDKVVDDAQRRRGEKVKDRRRKVHAPEGAELASIPDEAGPQEVLEEPQAESTNIEEEEEQQQHANGTRSGDMGDSGLLPSQAAAKAAAAAPLPTDSLPSLSWHFLRYLSLADNALTFLPSAPLLALQGLTHLDLSSNLLNTVPPALAALPVLSVLNLSINLLESVLGIYTLIPHIRVLNLSHNRLDSLCGLERLSALRRIDLRHNEIYDVGEIGRLVDCARLTEVWVGTGNIGLWEERPDWRIECFVLFEQEGRFGLKIDGDGPGWLEKGRIKERVPQTAKWKQAKAEAEAQAKEEAAKVAAAAAAKSKSKGKAKAVHSGNGSELEEAEAEVASPSAYRSVVPKRAAGRAGANNAGEGQDRTGNLSPLARRRGATQESVFSDEEGDIDADSGRDADEGAAQRTASPSGRSLIVKSKRRESDASSTGGYAARMLAERHLAVGQRRRNRRLIDLENNAGAGVAVPPALTSLALKPSATENLSTASLLSSAGAIGSPGAVETVPERTTSPAHIAVASRRGSVLPEPPAELRAGAAAMSKTLSRTSTVSIGLPPPLSTSADHDATLNPNAHESDYSAMSDSEAIKKAVWQGRNDLAASPYVTAGADGAPTEMRPPPAWMNSVGRKSGAGVKLGSTAVGQVLSPGESSAGEGAMSSPGPLTTTYGSGPDLREDEVERAAQRQKRTVTHGKGVVVPPSTASSSAASPSLLPAKTLRPPFDRHDSTASSGGGMPAPAGLALPAETLAAELESYRTTPRKNAATSPRSPGDVVSLSRAMGTKTSRTLAAAALSAGSPPSSPRGAGPGLRSNADKIQARRSRVSLSMYDASPSSSAASPPTTTSQGLTGAAGGAEGTTRRTDLGGATDPAASDAFRRRIEALKGEVGDDWLRLVVARSEQERGSPKSGAGAAGGSTSGVPPRLRKESTSTRASRRSMGVGKRADDQASARKTHKTAVVDVRRDGDA